MAAGRPPKPTALKLVEGNKGKRAINAQEPDPEYLNDLTPPAWMPEEAKVVWNEVAPKLRRARVLTELDVVELSRACVWEAKFRTAAIMAAADPVHEKNISPWMIVKSMSSKQANAIFAQFGMSPVARSRISINPQDDLFSNGSPPAGKNYFS